MRQRVQDVVRVGDQLFSKRFPILTLWQTLCENFHPMRANYTRARYISEEFGSYLMTGRPARCHRDLKNAFATMLRQGQWFHAQTDNETVNEDRDAKIWLEQASKTMRAAMYDRRANFVRATKEGDGDFTSIGNAIITREVRNYDHFLFRCWHPRDVAWADDVSGFVDEVHFDWRPEARQLIEKFHGPGKLGVSPKLLELKDEETFRPVTCRWMLMKGDRYDLPGNVQRGLPWVSVYVDVENQHVMEEIPLRTNPATIPRWERGGDMFGQQYGYSPPTVLGLPDGRMMQQIVLSMLEASEKATNPPLIAVGEAINGGVNYYAAGVTQVDADYDERTGDVLRPITMQMEGIKFGADQMERLDGALDDSFYLSKLRFPQVDKQMTAYEANRLWEQYRQEALPLFEPVSAEYNGALCDGTFEDMIARGAFGAVEDMPRVLRGREIVWAFDTPVSVAAERALSGAFGAMIQTLTEGMQIDPAVRRNVDMNVSTRDAIDGGGAPAKWLLPLDQVKAAQQQDAEQAAAAAQAEKVAQGADVAGKVGDALRNAGQARQAMQDAGAV